MNFRAPPHIVELYGSTRKWKALKRRQLKEAHEALSKLRLGSGFFPCGAGPVDRAITELDIVYSAINENARGR